MTSFDSILKRTLQKCSTHPSLSTSSRSLASRSPSPQSIVDIFLPDAPSLRPVLMAAGAHPEISLAIDQVYQKRATDLRALCHQTITQLCSNQYSSEQNFVPVLTELYVKELVTWKEEVVALYLKRPSTTAGSRAQLSVTVPRFNHEYVPLLEYFFSENPFPTHADKVFLAKKSSMTYRQIHVWFQNRRNRTKREGKELRQKPISEGITLPLGPLLQSMEKFIVPEQQRENASSLSISDLTASYEANPETSPVSDILDNALESLAPPHAFPSPYPPLCSYDPFPSRSGQTSFDTPKWFRTPVQTPVRYPPVDFDWLIGQFSRMNVVDDFTRGKIDSFAAVAAITVRPLSAPHPALIRGKITPITGSISLPSVPATVARRHVFNTPSPQSSPATLIPTLETSKTRWRKVAPLPRRVPHGNLVSYQDTTPAISETSVTSSRSSSFGPDSSSQIRLFSSTSSTPSSSSSTILTPPSSSHSLLAQLPSPSASSFNQSSTAVDLLGDASQSPPSPAEELQLDFHSTFLRDSRILKLSTGLFNALPAANLIRSLS